MSKRWEYMEDDFEDAPYSEKIRKNNKNLEDWGEKNTKKIIPWKKQRRANKDVNPESV